MQKNLELAQKGVIIYTDGACSGNPGKGGWAAIIIKDDTEYSLSGGEANTTNNRMELTAAIKALEYVANNAKENVILYTDSQYVKNGISSWIQTWKKNGWKTTAKQPVKNQDLWQKLDTFNQILSINWQWVRGHDGNHYNEECDRLAVQEVHNL